MPTISLRLSEEQHEALKESARRSQRSVQREVIYRLFSGLSERDHDSGGMTTSQPEGVGRISSDEKGPKAQPSIARSESSDEVEPDWRPTRKKK